jgi:NitT/TauT family transport system ATP-binding protein
VNLPEQRDQVDTKELPQFAHLRAHVFRQIKRKGEIASEEQTLPQASAPNP